MADPSRTESATPKRRDEMREKGNVPKSREVSSAVILLGSLAALHFSAGHMMKGLTDVLRDFFSAKPTQLETVAGMHAMLIDLVLRCGLILAPVMGFTMLCAYVANVAQVGFLFTMQPLTPNFEKLNPISGFSRLFSMTAIGELFKSLIKFSLVGLLAWRIIRAEIPVLPGIIDRTTPEMAVYFSSIVSRLIIHCGLAMLVLAAADYLFQRWNFEKSIKMTKDEVRQEGKDAEGDPAVKGRIRSLQREMSRRRIMKEVPKADVIITNPTHFAIALKYERGRGMTAPKVVAKGADVMARRIREIATEHGVPIVERPPLARALYANVDEGQEIPEEFYRAVAEVLAYVYKLRNPRIAV
ncbi:MAG TPA: flagellar biosynthesis protein FlhB [Candidatus Deferrimicrobiaceae bacterium]|jgi:flagellar biosynthetic protein FlhB